MVQEAPEQNKKGNEGFCSGVIRTQLDTVYEILNTRVLTKGYESTKTDDYCIANANIRSYWMR